MNIYSICIDTLYCISRDASDGSVTCNDNDGSRYLNQEMFGSSVSNEYYISGF